MCWSLCLSIPSTSLSQVNDFDAELLSAAEEGAEQVEERLLS